MSIKLSKIQLIYTNPFAELDKSSLGFIAKSDFYNYVQKTFPSKSAQKEFAQQHNPVINDIAFRTDTLFSSDTHFLIDVTKVHDMERVIESIKSEIDMNLKGYLTDSIIPIEDDTPPPNEELREKASELIKQGQERAKKFYVK